MILQALYELAEREGLMEDPDFEPKPVAWLIRVSLEGKFLGIEGTHYIPPGQENRKKPRAVAKTFSVPREGGRTSGDRAFFLYDKAEYALGIDPEKDESKRRPPEKLKIRFHLFRERVRQCLEVTGDEGVRAVHLLLEDVAAGNQVVSLPEDCAGNDLFAFVFAPDIDRLVTEREEVRSYWKRLRESPASEGPEPIQCLVSGQSGIPADLFPPLKKVPGGTSSGVALVSFNQRAFESYGWRGNENAPISRHAAEGCSTALNRLLHPAYPDPHQLGQSLETRHLRLSADTVVCYWSASKSGDDFASVFGALLEANPAEVDEVYRSIWRGKLVEIEDPSAFYALTITGTQGRAIIRDWFEATVAEVSQNLATHFADLDIVPNSHPPKGEEHPPHFPLALLFEALADPAKNRQESVPIPLSVQFIKAAFSGTLYPLAVLQRALLRFRNEIGKEQDPKEGWRTRRWNDARAALIKAVLNRRMRFSSLSQTKEVQRTMDPNNRNPGYLFGRLMAVIERMQQVALGNLNASVVDRFFSGASATPRAVFPRLLKNLRHHARKAKDDSQTAGTAGWLEGQLDDIMADIKSFPPHLDLEQQGLFVLGYHHQRNWLWMKKEERETVQSPV